MTRTISTFALVALATMTMACSTATNSAATTGDTAALANPDTSGSDTAATAGADTASPGGKLKWSAARQGMENQTLEMAKDYCTSVGGRLPTISELRTLVKGCPAIEPGGSCKVTDTCLSKKTCLDDVACKACGANGKNYSVNGDTGLYFTSSPVGDADFPDMVWVISFYYGMIAPGGNGSFSNARCILP